ncbi:hypothetical protein [Sinosporangium siamense]|nr:hypothetical protein [Sinosporangium siamense]
MACGTAVACSSTEVIGSAESVGATPRTDSAPSDAQAAGPASSVTAKPADPRCDDRIKATRDVPKAMIAKNLLYGVGEGDVWFIAAEGGRWGERVEKSGAVYRGKFPLWVDGAKSPEVTVRGVAGTQGAGVASAAPTAEGLPGPLPMGIEIPASGCWEVTAIGTAGTARITVHIGR